MPFQPRLYFGPFWEIIIAEPFEQWRRWTQARQMRPRYEALLAERARVEAEAGPVVEAIIAASERSGAEAAAGRAEKLERAVEALAFGDQRASVCEYLNGIYSFHGWYFDRDPRLVLVDPSVFAGAVRAGVSDTGADADGECVLSVP